MTEYEAGEQVVRSNGAGSARIDVTEQGPYRVSGDVAIFGAEGDLLRQGGVWHLCRCGGSRNKPFCDITHGLKRFDGSESADRGPIAQRRDSYAADGVTVYDDRTVCCHYGQCTSRLPAVFRAGAEPFVDAERCERAEIIAVVGRVPVRGARLRARRRCRAARAGRARVDHGDRRRALPRAGSIPVFGADGRAYERRARQVLCRCGLSRNKPFCDGSHWYAGFRDPLPPELVKRPPTALRRDRRDSGRWSDSPRASTTRSSRARPAARAHLPRDGSQPPQARRGVARRDIRRSSDLFTRARRVRAHAGQAPQPRAHRGTATALDHPDERHSRRDRTAGPARPPLYFPRLPGVGHPARSPQQPPRRRGSRARARPPLGLGKHTAVRSAAVGRPGGRAAGPSSSRHEQPKSVPPR